MEEEINKQKTKNVIILGPSFKRAIKALFKAKKQNKQTLKIPTKVVIEDK